MDQNPDQPITPAEIIKIIKDRRLKAVSYATQAKQLARERRAGEEAETAISPAKLTGEALKNKQQADQLVRQMEGVEEGTK
ncbi:hypothetical protein HY404_04290 [Candidatus Microgenomates bacterium]|nr:hypothetical protein [Candidatus Microgenomates bacterium]